jgi:hypothetical protein
MADIDPFEARCREMMECTPQRRVEMTEELRSRCLCPTCPTHTDCAKERDEKLFCDAGKSFQCIVFERQCLCPTCPVHDSLQLKHQFYCTRGAEKTRRYEREIWGVQF